MALLDKSNREPVCLWIILSSQITENQSTFCALKNNYMKQVGSQSEVTGLGCAERTWEQ